MNNKFLIEIDNIFTKEECNFIIKKAHEQNLTKINRSGFATYYRTIIDNKQLANHLFNKLSNYIPDTFNGQHVVCLNNFFRFSKYENGEFFNIHKDGINQDKHGNRSVMTLNIFLNDDFDGGETDFYLDDKKTLRYSVKPKPGRGALFDSQQYHCGNIVKNGYKYLLRTDVMVR